MSKSKLPCLRGVKSSAKLNQLLTSTGIAAVDVLLGGGIPVGTICVIEDEELHGFSNCFADCFAAEGVVCSHDVFATLNSKSENYFEKLPAPVFERTSSESSGSLQNDILAEDSAIAWRYKNLSVVNSSLGSNSAQGHHFNRKKFIASSLLQNCQLYSIVLSPSENNWITVERELNQILNKDIYRGVEFAGDKNILRILLRDFGSPLWGSTSKLLSFLYKLKCLVRNRNAVAFLTIPVNLLNDSILLRIRHYCDAAFRLEYFNEKNQIFDNFEGLFRIKKLPTLNSVNFTVPDCLDLAFKLKKGKIVIEKLHTPVEISDSLVENAKQQPVLSCSSNLSRSKLDF